MTTVTAVMPLYNEAADIGDVLASLSAQTYDHAAMHAIVVDGGSTDGSRELVQAWLAKSDISGELLDNPKRAIPVSLNLGIARAAAASIIVRLDAHTTYATDYIATIVAAFETAPSTVACIGGAQTPRPESRFDLALVTALYTNPFGLGGAAFRTATEPQLARGVYLGAWRPGVLQAAGGFNEGWIANEDGELAARLSELGYQTLFVPARSAYRVKRGPLSAIRQWGKYGYWRAQTLRLHPAAFRLRHLAPPLGLAIGLALLATPLRAVALALYAVYAAGILSARKAGESPLVTLAACVFFPACQAAWGAGLVRGLLTPPDPKQRASGRRARSRARLDTVGNATGSHPPQ